jgi:hypothetical protein
MYEPQEFTVRTGSLQPYSRRDQCGPAGHESGLGFSIFSAALRSKDGVPLSCTIGVLAPLQPRGDYATGGRMAQLGLSSALA